VSSEKTVENVFKIALRGVMIAVPVVLVVSLGYLAGYLQRGDAFLDKIYYENFARLTSSMEDEPHKHAAPYMLLMLALGFLPWTIVWVSAALRSFSKRNYTITALRELWGRATELQRYAFVAAAFIFIFFCIPSSKRSVYIMPAYPFIALLAAESVSVWGDLSKRLMRVLASSLVWFSFIVAVLVVLGALLSVTPEVAQFGSSLLGSWSLWKYETVVTLLALALGARWLFQECEVQRLALSMVGAVVVLSGFAAEPVFYQLSPRIWLRSSEFQSSLDLSKYDRIYSFGSEAYVSSFYLKKPFFVATPGLPPGSIVVVEEKNLARLKQEIAPAVREVARFSSGLEPSKKDVVFVEVVQAVPIR
jgi:hypothetical protein